MEDRFVLASVSKLATACFVCRLAERGVFDPRALGEKSG